MPVLSKHAVLSGPVDFCCLVCEATFRDSEDALRHVQTSQHADNFSASSYVEKYAAERIRKAKQYLYCEACNVVISSSRKIQSHIAEETHGFNSTSDGEPPQDNIFTRQEGKVVVYNDILLEESAWNGLVEESCVVCDVDWESLTEHVMSARHVINLIRSEVHSGPGRTLFRAIDSTQFQCLTCNAILPQDQFLNHWSSISHKNLQVKCRKAKKALDESQNAVKINAVVKTEEDQTIELKQKENSFNESKNAVETNSLVQTDDNQTIEIKQEENAVTSFKESKNSVETNSLVQTYENQTVEIKQKENAVTLFKESKNAVETNSLVQTDDNQTIEIKQEENSVTSFKESKNALETNSLVQTYENQNIEIKEKESAITSFKESKNAVETNSLVQTGDNETIEIKQNENAITSFKESKNEKSIETKTQLEVISKTESEKSAQSLVLSKNCSKKQFENNKANGHETEPSMNSKAAVNTNSEVIATIKEKSTKDNFKTDENKDRTETNNISNDKGKQQDVNLEINACPTEIIHNKVTAEDIQIIHEGDSNDKNIIELTKDKSKENNNSTTFMKPTTSELMNESVPERSLVQTDQAPISIEPSLSHNVTSLENNKENDVTRINETEKIDEPDTSDNPILKNKLILKKKLIKPQELLYQDLNRELDTKAYMLNVDDMIMCVLCNWEYEKDHYKAHLNYEHHKTLESLNKMDIRAINQAIFAKAHKSTDLVTEAEGNTILRYLTDPQFTDPGIDTDSCEIWCKKCNKQLQVLGQSVKEHIQECYFNVKIVKPDINKIEKEILKETKKTDAVQINKAKKIEEEKIKEDKCKEKTSDETANVTKDACEEDEDTKFYRQHHISIYGRYAECSACDAEMSYHKKGIMEHINGARHKRNCENYNTSDSDSEKSDTNPKFDYDKLQTISMEDYVAYLKLIGENCLVNNRVFVSIRSFCLIESNLCLCCNVEIGKTVEEFEEHVNGNYHKRNMAKVQVLKSVEDEFVRKLSNGKFYCSYCPALLENGAELFRHSRQDDRHTERRMWSTMCVAVESDRQMTPDTVAFIHRLNNKAQRNYFT